MTSRLEGIHAQLSQLLESAQLLLADSAPASSLLGNTGAGAGPTSYPYGYHPQQPHPQQPHGGAGGRGAAGMMMMPAVPYVPVYSFLYMQAEIRTLEFWRSILAECLATFFYVMIVLNVETSAVGANYQLSCALAAGLAMALIATCLGRVSGAHTSPAITLAAMLTRGLSPLRGALYMCAQCGGGIAGAALVKGVQGKQLSDPALVVAHRGATFGMEFVLTFLIAYAYCACKQSSTVPPELLYSSYGAGAGHQAGNLGAAGTSSATTGAGPMGASSWRSLPWVPARFRTTTTTASSAAKNAYSLNDATGGYLHRALPYHHLTALSPGRCARVDPLGVGIAYAAALVCWKGALNPARALGAAFVSEEETRFKDHWVLWVGPLLGALSAAICCEYIFSTRRRSLYYGQQHPYGHSYGSQGGFGFGYGYGPNYGFGPHPPSMYPHQPPMYGPDGMGGPGGGYMGPHHPMMGPGAMGPMMDDPEMLDDMEHAKQQYKANMMGDFPPGDPMHGMYGPGGRFGGPPYKRPYGPEPIYGGTKSMFNQSIYDSKSPYHGGYDSMGMGPLRRSRSIHSKFPPPPGSRRNPYDYLPEEPPLKPSDRDLLQSTIVNENGTSRLAGKSSASAYGATSGAAGDAYVTDKLDGTGYSKTDSAYDTGGGTSSYGKGRFGSSSDPYGTTAASRAARDYYSSGAGTAGSASAAASGTQYNATYSQQNGCSITSNALTGGAPAAGGAAAGAAGGSGPPPSVYNY